MHLLRTTRSFKRMGWLCALFLLLLNSAQAAHICGLDREFHPQHGNSAQLSNGGSTHTFCAICASCHSPSLAAPMVSLSRIAGPAESSVSGQVLERSALPIFALYIRPPPAF